MAAGGRTPEPDELAEDIAEIKRSLAELIGRIEALPFLRLDVYEARHTSLRNEIALEMAAMTRRLDGVESQTGGRFKTVEARIEKVEDRHTWVARTAVAGLLLPIIVALVVGALLAGGGS